MQEIILSGNWHSYRFSCQWIAATLSSKMSDVLCSTLAFSLEKLEYES
jgi:hypothetical protein